MKPELRLPASVPQRAAVQRILEAALQAADPRQAVARHLRREGDRLVVDDQVFRLQRFRRLILLGAGKAALAMADAVAAQVADRLVGGAVIVKGDPPYPTLPSCERVAVLPGDHPVPSQRSLRSTEHLLRHLQGLSREDLVLFVLSGGGSALLTAPVEGVSLSDLQHLTRALLASGADIAAINTLRRQLDRVKGGGLAAMAAPARLVALILSDVVGNPLEAIASGPVVPDPTTAADALDVLARYRLLDQTPPAVRHYLEQQEKRSERLPAFDHVTVSLVGDNVQAAQAARAQAIREGFHAAVLTTHLQGEARQAGRFLAGILRQMSLHAEPLPPPACLIAGGETTVTLEGATGMGGRNQEVALAAVPLLDGLPRAALLTLATDGEDGPTDAAGAVATGQTWVRAMRRGLSPQAFLQQHDSYRFFRALGDLIHTGPTGTNVNDLVFLFAFPPEP